MPKSETDLVVAICQEVDWLVTRDPGAATVEALERYRLRMNDLLMQQKWREAEKVAYRILLLREGTLQGAGSDAWIEG
jgi:hypothetical protein